MIEMFRKMAFAKFLVACAVLVVAGVLTGCFQITLLSYTNKPENYNSNSDVETYRVTIRVTVKFYDNVKERIIYENKSLSAEGVYDVQKNEAEDRHGQARAIEKLQDLIIANALAKW